MKKKDAAYYMGLNYRLIVRRVDEYDKPFYEVTTRELDPLTFYGVGDTLQEAADSLEEVKRDLFPYYVENGLEIPEPEAESEKLPSGKFVLRISPKLHRKLIMAAADERLSLNTFVGSILERYATVEALVREMVSKASRAAEKIPCGSGDWTREGSDNITRLYGSKNSYDILNEVKLG